jgi:hypothetical protein
MSNEPDGGASAMPFSAPLSTYIPKGKVMKRTLAPAAATIKLEPPPAATVEAAAAADLTWTTTCHAHALLVKRTGQPEIAAQIMEPPPRPSPSPAAAPAPPKAPTKRARVKAEEDEEREKEKAPRAPITRRQEDIQPLERPKRRDNDLALFAITVTRPHHRVTNDLIASVPPPVGTLKYCVEHKNEMTWYRPMSEAIGAMAGFGFPRTPLMTRDILMTFMREADPAAPYGYERPCFNLDRDPLEHEERVRCIAHVLSERIWGKERAFRLREMLWNNQSTKINAALAFNENHTSHLPPVDPRVYLNPVQEMCYMCHVWLTTEACFDHERKMKLAQTGGDGGDPPPPPKVVIFNRFMVDIDKVGEYDRRKMLVSSDVTLLGIWGPFPQWSPQNYLPVRIANSNNLCGFQESDELLFRLPRVPSQAIECAPANGFTQSTPMSVVRARTNFHP